MANTKRAKKPTKPAVQSFDFDTIIIGTGPGGEGAAMNLAKSNKRVAVIERHCSVGGGCTHWGTIPSKALRQSVSRLIELKTNPLFNFGEKKPKLSFTEILRHTQSVIGKQVSLRTSFYDRNAVKIYHGEASFVDANRIKVSYPDGATEEITAENIVIATGSRPYRPSNVDFSHPRIYDSDTILQLKHTPRSIIIYGAGVIGCEYASIFRGLSVKVDLINTRERLLSFLDAEISDSLSYHFWNSGVLIRHNEMFEKIEPTEDGVVLHMQSGKKMKADCLLFANGRTGNTDRLNLEAIGIKPDGRGLVKVNEQYQTDVANIYAIGDVVGYPSLASAAFDQGRIAANSILQDADDSKLIKETPTGIGSKF